MHAVCSVVPLEPLDCERERCPFAVVGEATVERQLQLSDSKEASGTDAVMPIDMPMEVLLGKPPRMHRDVTRVAQEFDEHIACIKIDADQAAEIMSHYNVPKVPTLLACKDGNYWFV